MTMEDGNGAGAAAAPVVDEAKIIDGLFNKLQQAGFGRSQEAPPEPQTQGQRNALLEIYNDLKARGMSDEFIAAQIGVATKIQKDVEHKVEAQSFNDARYKRDTESHSFIGRLIKAYAKEDERVSELEPVIRAKVAEKFNASAERRAEFGRNYVNETAIEDIVDEVVGDLSKKVLGLDKPKNPALGGRSKTTQEKNSEDGAKAKSFDDLNEDQQEFAIAHEAFLRQYKGMTTADANKEALSVAAGLTKYNPKAYRI